MSDKHCISFMIGNRPFLTHVSAVITKRKNRRDNRQQRHTGGQNNLPPRMLFHQGRADLSRRGVTLVGRLAHTTSRHTPETRPLAGQRTVDFANDYAQGVDVGARVNGKPSLLFRRGIPPSAGRLLQHGVAVSVRIAEVYQLHVAAIGGYHDVLRLQVAMDYLPAVDVREGVTHLRQHQQRVSTRQSAPVKHAAQRAAVDIFHDNTRPQAVNTLKTYGLGYVRMRQLVAYLKLLLQQSEIKGVVRKLRLQALQDMPLAHALRTVNHGMAAG